MAQEIDGLEELVAGALVSVAVLGIVEREFDAARGELVLGRGDLVPLLDVLDDHRGSIEGAVAESVEGPDILRVEPDVPTGDLVRGGLRQRADRDTLGAEKLGRPRDPCRGQCGCLPAARRTVELIDLADPDDGLGGLGLALIPDTEALAVAGEIKEARVGQDRLLSSCSFRIWS